MLNVPELMTTHGPSLVTCPQGVSVHWTIVTWNQTQGSRRLGCPFTSDSANKSPRG